MQGRESQASFERVHITAEVIELLLMERLVLGNEGVFPLPGCRIVRVAK
jgi:hypothetical protein